MRSYIAAALLGLGKFFYIFKFSTKSNDVFQPQPHMANQSPRKKVALHTASAYLTRQPPQEAETFTSRSLDPRVTAGLASAREARCLAQKCSSSTPMPLEQTLLYHQEKVLAIRNPLSIRAPKSRWSRAQASAMV